MLLLDTNIFIDNPNFLDQVEHEEIVIPFSVLEELDNLKKRDGELGESAREVIRDLESILTCDEVEYGTNTIRVMQDNDSIEKVDDRIIDLCSSLQFLLFNQDGEHESEFEIDDILIDEHGNIMENFGGREDLTLLSNDLNVKIKARSQGIKAESYYGNLDKEYIGYQDLYISDHEISDLFSQGFTCPLGHDSCLDKEVDIHINEYVNLLTHTGGSALTKYIGDNTFVLLGKNLSAWGEKPKNREQIFAIDALLDEEIPLVCLRGKGGTGKSFLTLATALEKVKERPKYDQIIITRALHTVGGKTIGFLPGSKDEKMRYWFEGMFDNLDQLVGSRENADLLIDRGMIEMQPLEYIRGRSLHNKFVIVEEAQNLTKEEAKALITRIGHNTKMVFLGDIDQRDNQRVTKFSNGLSYTIKFFHQKDRHRLMAHVDLISGKLRSEIADIAAEM